MSDLENQESIGNVTPIVPITPPDLVSIRQKISNYRNFYSTRYGVPSSEIFYSAAISFEELLELCNSSPKVRILITKNSDDNNNVTDFNFVILPADNNGDTALEERFIAPNKYIDINCCKYPPGGN